MAKKVWVAIAVPTTPSIDDEAARRFGLEKRLQEKIDRAREELWEIERLAQGATDEAKPKARALFKLISKSLKHLDSIEKNKSSIPIFAGLFVVHRKGFDPEDIVNNVRNSYKKVSKELSLPRLPKGLTFDTAVGYGLFHTRPGLKETSKEIRRILRHYGIATPPSTIIPDKKDTNIADSANEDATIDDKPLFDPKKNESPVAFFRRVWGEENQLGKVFQYKLAKKDPGLLQALRNYSSNHKIPMRVMVQRGDAPPPKSAETDLLAQQPGRLDIIEAFRVGNALRSRAIRRGKGKAEPS